MMDNETKDILEGFNAGYILHQKSPETYKQLQEAVMDVKLPFFKSFIDGGREYEQDRIRQLMSKDINFNSSKNSPTKDSPNKNHIEPDMDV